MNNKKNLFKFLGATVMLVALASCGAASNNPGRPQGDEYNSGNTPSIPAAPDTHKVIYQVDYEIYDDNFSKAASEISVKAVELDGYIVNSNQNNENGHYVFKIPTENLTGFVTFVDTYKVGAKTIQTVDVTGDYESVDSKIEELKKEKAEIESIIENNPLSDSEMARFQNRLNEINYQIKKYEENAAEQEKALLYSTVVIDFYLSKKTESDIYWNNYYYYLKIVGKSFGNILLYSAPFALISAGSIAAAYFLTKKKEH